MKRRTFIVGASAALGLVATGSIAVRRLRKASGTETIEFTESDARISEFGNDPEFDVCVIGSGPAGAVVASNLIAGGARIALLEAGVSPAEKMRDPRYETLSACRSVGPVHYPVETTRVMGPGGTSAIWTGRCPRLFPIDFEPNAYTPAGSEWPFRYEDIEHHFAQAEKLLFVDGESPEGLPRSTELPLHLSAHSQRYGATRQLMQKLGVSTVVTPTSIVPGHRAFRVARDLLPQVARAASASVVVGAVAHRFVLDASSRITGVVVRDLDGNARSLRARAYVLAGGAIECARRLLLCRTDERPNGLGNDFGRVGKSFQEHPVLSFVATLDGSAAAGFGEGFGLLRSFDFYERFKRDGLGSMILKAELTRGERNEVRFRLWAPIEMWPSDRSHVRLSADPGFVDAYGDPLPEVHLQYSDRDHATMDRARALMRALYGRAGARNVEELDSVWGYHHAGTTRMGTNSATSVVDQDLKVHGTPNLFVLSSGNFVTPGASNPMLLIVALAYRLSNHIQARLVDGDLPELSRSRAGV